MGQRVELLAPAGSAETLHAAVLAGADAVYVGGTRFGARAFAENFGETELLEAIDFMHLHGKKLYLTVNTLLRDREVDELYAYLRPCYERGLDAVIVQDIGVMRFLKEAFPKLLVHVSTQATVTSVSGADFFKELGAVRIVPARELSLREIRRIKEKNGLELECFIHGALCYCYSGQCLLSSMIGGRSGNRGQCAQPCRLPYQVGNGKRQDLMSLKDLETITVLPDLIEAGINSFKIEGRMKKPDYVYAVVSCYRKYIDFYLKNGRKNYRVSKKDRDELEEVYQRRGYETGYYFRHNGKEMISLNRPVFKKGPSLEIPDEKIQEKIKGIFILLKGQPAILEVNGGGCWIRVEGPVSQAALNQPLSTDRIEVQLKKTGNTPFLFEELTIKVEDGLFLPMQAVNEMRREALERLESTFLGKFRRECAGQAVEETKSLPATGRHDVNPASAEGFLSVLVSTKEQLEAALRNVYVGRVYIEAVLAFSILEDQGQEKNVPEKELFLAAPCIFREKAEHDFERYFPWIQRRFDGVLARNVDTVLWLRSRGYEKTIHTDSNVYVWNQWSKAVLENNGVDLFYAPAELNGRELGRLVIRGQGIMVYGRQSVMVAANCIRRTVSGCSETDGILYLKDRYQKQFPVRNVCRYCYNIINNCEPTFLVGEAEEIGRLCPSMLRLDFLNETGECMEQILEIYHAGFMRHEPVKMPDSGFTKGHFKRGVK